MKTDRTDDELLAAVVRALVSPAIRNNPIGWMALPGDRCFAGSQSFAYAYDAVVAMARAAIAEVRGLPFQSGAGQLPGETGPLHPAAEIYEAKRTAEAAKMQFENLDARLRELEGEMLKCPSS